MLLLVVRTQKRRLERRRAGCNALVGEQQREHALVDPILSTKARTSVEGRPREHLGVSGARAGVRTSS